MLYVFTDFLDLCAVNGVRREVKVAHLFFFLLQGGCSGVGAHFSRLFLSPFLYMVILDINQYYCFLNIIHSLNIHIMHDILTYKYYIGHYNHK